MATPKRYAVIDGGGNVINTVMWDGETPWTPPEGCTAEVATAEHDAKALARGNLVVAADASPTTGKRR